MRLIIIVGLLALLTPSLLMAQEQTSEAMPVNVLERAFRSNWQVRAVLVHSDTLVGRVRGYQNRYEVGGTGLELVDVVALDRLSTSGGGGVLGAVVGGIVFGAIGAGVTGMGDVADTGNDGLTVAVFAGVGVLVGYLTGHLINPGTSRWLPVWPDP